MVRLAWSKEVLNYLKDNQGLINQLELAFADLRQSSSGLPPYGIVDEGIGADHYIWRIHGHAILIRKGVDHGHPKLWVEAIKPIAPDFSE
ncbi:MAG TPA: hypothetical protein P5121_36820 [Caldilineaceae bacterium]|nr:hypothetical protein [Caldilineaceae bacterium]